MSDQQDIAPAAQKPSRPWTRSLVEIIAAFLVVMAAKGALAEPFYVPSGSMEPTLLIGDALRVALLVCRPRIGCGLLHQFAEIVLDDLNTTFDFLERWSVAHIASCFAKSGRLGRTLLKFQPAGRGDKAAT